MDYQECNGNGAVMNNGTTSNGNNNHTPTRVPLAIAEEDFQGNMEPTMVIFEFVRRFSLLFMDFSVRN